jgi:hypothetical protein
MREQSRERLHVSFRERFIALTEKFLVGVSHDASLLAAQLLRTSGLHPNNQTAQPCGAREPDIRPDLRFIYHAPMAFFAFLIVRGLGWIFRWGRPHCANELEILILRHQLKVLRRRLLLCQPTGRNLGAPRAASPQAP